jgi:hypothetical protein
LESISCKKFLLDEYSPEFYKSLLDYGYEFADTVINKKQYHLFDPMISDWSCHIRAIWLCCFLFFKKIENLDEEDFFFFGLVRLLDESAVLGTHEIIKRLPIKTSNTYWPNSVSQLKNYELKIAFKGKSKRIVSTRILRDLKRLFREIPDESIVLGSLSERNKRVKEELLHCFSSPCFAIFNGIAIPMLPFIHGYVMVFSLAAYFDVHLYNLHKDVKKGELGNFFVANSRIDHFCYKDTYSNFVRTDEEQAQKTPSIVFETYRFSDNTDDCKESIDAFLTNATKTNFSYIDFIYFIAIIHNAFPSNKLNDNTKLGCCFSDIIEKYRKLVPKLNICSNKLVQIFSETERVKEVCLDQTLFDIIHVRSGSILNL